jgi:ankyrin repeat protein
MQSVSDCWNFSIECLESILAAGADVNARDNDGKTALIHAVYVYNKDLVNEFRVKNFVYVVDRLLKAGTDKSIKDNSGKTAFDYAKEQKDLANTEAYRQLKPDS